MKRAGTMKFPNSAQLFKFCHRIMVDQSSKRVHDQQVGAILDFNPSDCSHWKRGEKNIRSVFALEKLSSALNLESSLVHDVVSGHVTLDEGFFEYKESARIKKVLDGIKEVSNEELDLCRKRVMQFVASIHQQCEFQTAPLYLPEVLRMFSFIQTQASEVVDKLSRILRVKEGHYSIQYKRGDLKAQTRMSIVKDLSRIIFEGERERFPELGETNKALVKFEELLFSANILAPLTMISDETAKLDSRRNIVRELSAIFWVPKTLVGFQLQESIRSRLTL